MRKLLAIGMVALVAAACAPVEEPLAQPETTTTIRDMAETTTTTTEVEVEEIPQSNQEINRLVAVARTDLSTRLGVVEEEIQVTSLETGVWRDSSLGCPEPDKYYTQVITPGVRVALSHDKNVYWYHQGGSQELFLCPESDEGAFVGSGADQLIPPPGYDQ